MAKAHDVKNQFQEVQHKINEISQESNRVREYMNSSIKTLQFNIDRVGQNNGTDMSGLNQRIVNLESQMSSLSSSGNGSSGSVGSNKDNMKKLEKLMKKKK